MLFTEEYLHRVATEIFLACGAPANEAAIVSGELVETSLMGIDSHGVIRIPEYVDKVQDGTITPGAVTTIVKQTPTTAVVDGHWNFGAICARNAAELARAKAATQGVASVLLTNCPHVGRLGASVQWLAEQGFISLATACGTRFAHWVTPWGGCEGRLATNPIAYGIPTRHDPIVLDMSTSMIAEGKIRSLLQQGKPVPAGCIQDAAGHPTTDPTHFYGPPQGTILPFGSEYGYKGFALGLLVEILGRTLAGYSVAEEGNSYRLGNGVSLTVISPDAFCGLENFRSLMDELSGYVTSSAPAPGHDRVIMPGELDFRSKAYRALHGIPVADQTWNAIVGAARKVGVAVAAPAVSAISQADVAGHGY